MNRSRTHCVSRFRVGFPTFIAGVCLAVWIRSCAGAVVGSDCVSFGDLLSSGGGVLCRRPPPPMDVEDCLLLETGLPGYPYRFTEYSGQPFSDGNPAFGLQLHHPRFLEFVGAPESARLLCRSPTFWVDQLGQEQAMAAAINLQLDAGIMLCNLQILSQFATSLHRMSSEMIVLGIGQIVFPRAEVADFCHRRRRRLGQPGTCRPWACGALRRVRVIPGQCRLRPAGSRSTV